MSVSLPLVDHNSRTFKCSIISLCATYLGSSLYWGLSELTEVPNASSLSFHFHNFQQSNWTTTSSIPSQMLFIVGFHTHCSKLYSLIYTHVTHTLVCVRIKPRQMYTQPTTTQRGLLWQSEYTSTKLLHFSCSHEVECGRTVLYWPRD